jgi:hypothetical protein
MIGHGPAQTETSVRQHSLVRSIVLILLSSVVIFVLYIIIAPSISRLVAYSSTMPESKSLAQIEIERHTLAAAQAQSLAEKQKGFTYASWESGEYSHPDADQALANLADTGADWIALVVTHYQDNISSTTIYTTTSTPTDTDLIHAIAQAHSLGLKVMLKPHLDLENDPDHWRGEIGEGFTETDWNTWFAAYQGFIYHYADLAQAHGADQFCIGTELSASQDREANWRAAISGIRGYYSGPLTYAANFGDEVSITWWDAVDYIGVDAYYELTDKNDPTIAEMKAAWQPHLTTLETLASTWGKSIILTEVGFRSIDGANQRPWDWDVTGTVNLQEQADAYQATFESVYNQPWLAGLYWWTWETGLFQGGPCDNNYTPYDKPAEDVLRSWYGAAPRNDGPPLVPDYGRALNIYTDALAPGWQDWSWDATVDLYSNDPVYSGTQAISITAQAWGALSFYHASFDPSPYHWLEFYVRKSYAEQRFAVFAHDGNSTELRYRLVDECRHTDERTIEPGIWTRVRIPLSDLDASDRQLQQISIINYNSQSSTFWVDEIQLVGALQRVCLPMVIWNSQ